MKRRILAESYQEISEDVKLVRLATVTKIVHSLIFVFYIIYQSHFLISKINKEIIQIDFKNYMEILFGDSNITMILAIIGVALGIGYFILPPIADGALIFYVNSKERSGSAALSKGFMKFFPMLEFNSMISLFSFLVFFIALSRLYVMGILQNNFIITIIIIWILIIICVSLFFQYVKFLIILENYGVGDAMRKSLALSIENFNITFRFVIINYILYLRFIFNILIIVGIPGLMIYLIIKFGYIDLTFINYIMYAVFGVMILITAYINGIIEAFFITYWYKVFKHLNRTEE